MRRALAAGLMAWLLLVPGLAQAQTQPEVVLEGLDFLTNAAWAPDGRLFVLEKNRGEVLIVEDGEASVFAQLPVIASGEQGLLGIALAPDFATDPWVYVYFSDPDTHLNRIVRIREEDGRGTTVEPVIDLLTTDNGIHNGGDILFGPDGLLYVTTGDIAEAERAQDPRDLAGKILRLNPDGSPAGGNPFGNATYSLGHRNSFGLCFDVSGRLWETENGPEAFDEVNRIEPGGNYGWPIRLGPEPGPEPSFSEDIDYIEPALAFEEIIVPTGCVAREGVVWFGDMGGHLYRYDGTGDPEVVHEFPEGITDLQFAPDGDITVITLSTIWRLPAGDAPPGTAASAPPRAAAGERERLMGWMRWLAIGLGAAAGVLLVISIRRRRAG